MGTTCILVFSVTDTKSKCTYDLEVAALSVFHIKTHPTQALKPKRENETIETIVSGSILPSVEKMSFRETFC